MSLLCRQHMVINIPGDASLQEILPVLKGPKLSRMETGHMLVSNLFSRASHTPKSFLEQEEQAQKRPEWFQRQMAETEHLWSFCDLPHTGLDTHIQLLTSSPGDAGLLSLTVDQEAESQ